MFCSQCGSQIADNSLFCPTCGKQVMRPQSQPQGQVVQPNPQPQMQQPRPQMQGQIPPQQPGSQVPPQQQKPPKKKKKGVVGIIILVIVLILLLLALIIGAIAIVIFSGVLKSPKKMFAENVVKITENINGEIPSIGSIPLEALFHLGVDDTQNSHTSIRTTEIMSDAMSQYDLELVQTYSYNKDNGDAAYDFTVNVNGNPTGNGSIYFTDDEFLYVPMNPDSPMVKYDIDSDTLNSLKDLGAMERFSLMVLEKERGSEINWNQEIKDFTNDVLGDIPKSSFKKSKEKYMLLGVEQTCKTVTVTASDKEAFDLMESIGKLMYKGIEADEDMSAFESVLSAYEDNGGTLDLTMTTYRYKKTPVAVTMEVNLNGEVSTFDISYYKKGSEKQFIIDTGDSYYEESVVSKGIGQTHMTNKIDFGSAFLTIEQDSTGIGNSKELKGTFEICPAGDSDTDSMATIAGKTITGTIEETSILGNGVKTTEISSEKGSVSIVTTMERSTLDTSKITPPTFLSESGIDCGSSLEDLKETLEVFNKDDSFKVDNSLVHIAQVFYLIFKQSGIR